MFVTIPIELVDVLNEALAISYQLCEDDESKNVFKEAMWVLETAEFNADGTGAARVVSGENGEWKFH